MAFGNWIKGIMVLGIWKETCPNTQYRLPYTFLAPDLTNTFNKSR